MSPLTPSPSTVLSHAEQIRLLTKAIASMDPGEARESLIARRDKLIAERMTPLIAGRRPRFVAPLQPLGVQP